MTTDTALAFSRFYITPEPKGLRYEPALDSWAVAHYREIRQASGYRPEDNPAVYRLTASWRGFRKGALLVKPAYGYSLSFAVERPRPFTLKVWEQAILPGIEQW